ncbi:MFS transporter [Thermogymnomonas acidicola]|uniref:MFS transporter n=1 Tax=Thermogymnomonas acidicola TaxID=399579 RepID=UPI00094678DE|nr:MFS transporter [Thermogymnomonas acidicola]
MVAVGTFSFFMNSLVRYFIPSLLPVIEELDGISIVKASLLVTAYWSTYTAMQIPSGFISDRFGQATVNKASFLAMTALFSCFLALHSFAGLLAIQLLLGASSSLVYISDVSLIQRVSEPSRRAHASAYTRPPFLWAHRWLRYSPSGSWAYLSGHPCLPSCLSCLLPAC